jgi:putative ABC transport system substrate-binding protein
VTIEYRGGPPRLDPLRELVIELIRREVAVIVTANDGPALAAKRATSTIPIVFFDIGSDPVTLRLVASINRPGGNVTGASFDAPQLVAKRFDLLCQLVPTAETVAYLTNGRNLLSFEEVRTSLVAAAGARNRQLIVVECRSNDELGNSFATIVERGAGAVVAGTLFGVNADAIVSLAVRHKIPLSGFASRGGLMSFEPDLADQMLIVAGLVGKILKGAKPADLPVRRSTKFHFVINLQTAKQLGLSVPQHFLVQADELIGSPDLLSHRE